ncbi:transcriptional regulator [Peribacillus frigoritolerans]|uniref:transcriptional regulator n=1 Tax=Peribacillus frigoritolerans TaxID=450367 RepID=UPI001EFE28F6|nr:transcriptional regulator [Peribacillus frigoritolerans]ULM98798.1 transcriptional regulator [Peribacillus frigoritolerans]
MKDIIELIQKYDDLDVLKEFDKEVANNSDRGIALICGSIIDEILKELLKEFFIENSKIDKELFGVNQTLGTFDAKYKIAYYLGLINEIEMKNIVLLQRIRNKFAHQIIGISFENEEIKNIAFNFKIPKNGFIPPVIPFQKGQTSLPKIDLNPIKKDTNPRDKFIFTFKYLYMALHTRILIGLNNQREELKDIHTADQTIILEMEVINKVLQEYKELTDRVLEFKEEYEEDLNKVNQKLEKIKNIKTDDGENIKVILLRQKNKIEEALNIKDEEAAYFDQIKKYFGNVMKIQKYSLEVVKNSIE